MGQEKVVAELKAILADFKQEEIAVGIKFLNRINSVGGLFDLELDALVESAGPTAQLIEQAVKPIAHSAIDSLIKKI